MPMAHLYLSAAHKSSGKTTVTTGICAALAARKLNVRPFKKGPDYIDPMWLSAAANAPCYNLDFNVQDEASIRDVFARQSAGGDIAIIEGNKGLYDGMDVEGSNSNAALAKLLGAPVVLVLDARGMTRGVAPLLQGYRGFDGDVNIAGVIFNMVGGARQEEKLRQAVERYTDIPVLGAVHKNAEVALVERHLGLMTRIEDSEADRKIARLGEVTAAGVDLDRLIEIAKTAPAPAAPAPLPPVPAPDVTLAVARDAAFDFYYPDDLEGLARAGAKLVFFDTLSDTALPGGIDGLFIGGGFPETHIAALAANTALRGAIKAAIEGGLPTYAECGGLMYLARSLIWRDERGDMAGVIPGDAVMHERPQGRGYVRLRATSAHPWPENGQNAPFAAHEFHYSSLENLDGAPIYAYEVLRGHGIDGKHDGLVMGNLLATYGHLRDVDGTGWTQRFVNFVRAHKT